MESHQIVGNVVVVDHRPGGLRKLEIILRAKCRWPNVGGGIDQRGEVEGQLHPYELNILPAAVGNIAILHRQEDVRVLGHHRVLVHIPVDVMKAKDGEAAEVVPRILKKIVASR